MRSLWIAVTAFLLAAVRMTGCGSPEPGLPAPSEGPERAENTQTEEEEKTMLTLRIGETAVAVDWEENESVSALMELCRAEPRTVSMEMYGGFEQVGALGTSLPRQDTQTTTQAGDIVLYSGDQIVVFYGSNAWAYTRLGHITDKDADALRDLLGNGNVTLTLALEW